MPSFGRSAQVFERSVVQEKKRYLVCMQQRGVSAFLNQLSHLWFENIVTSLFICLLLVLCSHRFWVW
jgi:hypothetical protein